MNLNYGRSMIDLLVQKTLYFEKEKSTKNSRRSNIRKD